MSGRYDWLDFEPEPDGTGDGSGDPDKHILTIRRDGEEYAIIVHRACYGRYPLDGVVADAKRSRAQHIVDTLNAADRRTS